MSGGVGSDEVERRVSRRENCEELSVRMTEDGLTAGKRTGEKDETERDGRESVESRRWPLG